MADIEKVISEFEDFVKSFSKRDDTYYKGLFVSVLALLKEQDNLLRKKQKDINKLQADYAELRHKFLEKTQIVRCNDCKHYENGGWFTQCFRHNGISPDVDWFCADGERKKGR